MVIFDRRLVWRSMLLGVQSAPANREFPVNAVRRRSSEGDVACLETDYAPHKLGDGIGTC